MADIKITLGSNETIQDVNLKLFKALNHQLGGDIHNNENFEDPAMTHLLETLNNFHDIMYSEMIDKIIEEIDKEYSDGIL